MADTQSDIINIVRAYERRGEWYANSVRTVFMMLGFAATLGTLQVNTITSSAIYAVCIGATLLGSLVLHGYLWRLHSRDEWHPWLKYVTITADLLALAGTAVAATYNHAGILEYFLSFMPVFVFFNALSGLRLDPRACLYSGLLSMVINLSILWVAVAFGLVDVNNDIAHIGASSLNVLEQVTFIVIYSSVGPLAGVIAFQGRGLARSAGEESINRARLEKEKARLGKYLSEDLVEMVLQNPDKVELGGIRKTATIMFTDIRNFTPFSERHAPEVVVQVLNHYFTRMVELVFRNGGTLDKFMGDGLMAEFGVPVEVAHAPLRAVLAAIEMLEVVRSFNEVVSKSGLPPLEMGVGIATGPVIAGNIGSPKRMDYTCIGDCVNLAARIEGLNPQLATNILIDEATYQQIQGVVPVRKLEKVRVKGKSKEVQLYSVEPTDIHGTIIRLRALLSIELDPNATMPPDFFVSLPNALAEPDVHNMPQ